MIVAMLNVQYVMCNIHVATMSINLYLKKNNEVKGCSALHLEQNLFYAVNRHFSTYF